jgi:S1-C subfamily serine protease
VKKYDYGATYWAKYKLGITTFIIGHADFKPELRQRIRSNKGIQVLASIKATPAYNADIMTGNVLLKLNEHVIRSKNDIRHLIKDNEGKVFKVELWRNGNIITKNVKVGNPIIE